jgi:hypothetical protein
MKNRIKGPAQLTLSDGRVLTIEYDFDGLIALEEASGMKMPEVYAEMGRLERTKQPPSLRLARAIIYGGLQQHHPEIGLKEAGNLILNETDAIGRAMKAFGGAHGPAGSGNEEGSSASDEADPPKSNEAGTGAGS